MSEPVAGPQHAEPSQHDINGVVANPGATPNPPSQRMPIASQAPHPLRLAVIAIPLYRGGRPKNKICCA
ncbi:MAG: hypothetical protein U0802_16355 [Candidatus Binatia bacterium]